MLTTLALAAPAAAADEEAQVRTSDASPGQSASANHRDAAAAKPGEPGAGARSIGDSLFPQIGNGGYNARHYDIRQGYDPLTDVLDGRTALTAIATRQLNEFSLDFQGLTVSGVTVDGKPAAFSREGSKLIVSPKGNIRSGKTFVVEVAYSGIPQTVIDPDGSSEGWFATPDGAFVVGQPIGAQGWFPNNNTPRDKATFDVRTTVPAGTEVVGNGSLVSRETAGGKTTFHWSEPHLMSTYLATSTLGLFDVTRSTLLNGIEMYNAVDPGLTATQKATTATRLNRQPQIVEAYSSLYGPYAFDVVGAAVDRAFIGYALESQSISNYDRAPGMSTIAHEIAHQWYGNAVTPRDWVDIWLNEGFATWVQWDWSARYDGAPSTATQFNTIYNRSATNPFWSVPPAAIDDQTMFDPATYQRGAATLEALRQIVGDDTFFAIMRSWFADNRYGIVDTDDFVALAEEKSGRDLGAFFQDYLYEADKPAPPSAYAG